AHGDCLDDVSAGTKTAIGDHVHVASAGFIQVVAAGCCNVGDGGGHWCMDAQRTTGGAGGAAADADKYASSTGARQVKCRGVAGSAAYDDRHVEFADELLEVQRFVGL